MDKEQFILLIDQNKLLIYKICRTYCSDPEQRKDLQQEILIQLWRSLGRFDGRVKLSTWIYRVALNTAISFLRGETRRRKGKTGIDPAVISLPDDAPDTERDENIALLYRFIGELNDLEKALMLLYLDGLKQAEIAAILGISETNVATKIGRIKNRLKEQFTNELNRQ